MPAQVTFQDYSYYKVRDAAILTNSYVQGGIIGNNVDFTSQPVSLQNQLTVYLDFTIGSLTDLLVKFEFSADNVTYFQETNTTISGGLATVVTIEHKFTASGKYRIALPIKDRYIKVSALGEGTVTSSTLTITSVIGVQ